MKKLVKILKHLDFTLFDLLSLFFSFVVANYVYLKSLNYYDFFTYGWISAVFLFSFVFSVSLDEPYSGILIRDNAEEIKHCVKFGLCNLFITIILLYVLKFSAVYSRVVVILTYFLFIFISFCVKILWKNYLLKHSNNENIKSLLIVCEKQKVMQILNNINKEKHIQYDIKGVCVTNPQYNKLKINIKNCCNIEDIGDYVISNNINEVFFALSPSKIDNTLIKRLLDNGICVHLNTEDIFGFDAEAKDISNVGVFSTFEIGSFYLSDTQIVYLAIKRLFDIVLSLFGLLITIIVTVIVAIVNRVNGDRGPIFYKHQRVGKDGNAFNLYKFRTMCINSDEILEELLKDEKYLAQWNEYHKLDEDPRITKVGAILRKTSLDELPQFLNVLLGDMSLIGPRPLAIDELKQHNGLRLYERVKPGITGWWACNGRSNITYKERLELEYYYVRNVSFGLDLLIIFRTVYCVLKKSGAK